MRARSATLTTVLVVVFAVVSCKQESAAVPDATAVSSSKPQPVASVSAPRRPARRHYLARTNTRCEIYAVEHDVVSPAEPTPCPESLEVGERIRIAGRTCIREGRVDRRRPVVCPNALLDADWATRDGGP